MERYRLSELTTLTGLTPRTIRFYIAEGLLPPPEGAGPAAVYTAGHRDRLQLIGRLKDRYLPLREIRRRLVTLSDEEVRGELADLGAPAAAREGGAGAMGRALAEPGGAVDYLDDVLGRTRAAPSPYPLPPPPPARVPPPAPAPARERWERVALADGVELHIREDRRREGTLIDALVRQARKLLGEA